MKDPENGEFCIPAQRELEKIGHDLCSISNRTYRQASKFTSLVFTNIDRLTRHQRPN